MKMNVGTRIRTVCVPTVVVKLFHRVVIIRKVMRKLFVILLVISVRTKSKISNRLRSRVVVTRRTSLLWRRFMSLNICRIRLSLMLNRRGVRYRLS